MKSAKTADRPGPHLVNLTPHQVSVIGADGQPILILPARKSMARLVEVSEQSAPLILDGVAIPTLSVRYADHVEGLPSPSAGTAYVVSRVLAEAVPRADLYFPADEVRDQSGQVLGCRALGQFTVGVA